MEHYGRCDRYIEKVLSTRMCEEPTCFNPETNRVMIIDFERSLLLQPPWRALAQLVPNKQGWDSETTKKRKGGEQVSGRQQGCGDFGEDILMARSTFLELNWYE